MKKIFVLLTSILMLFTLCSCGKGKSKVNEDDLSNVLYKEGLEIVGLMNQMVSNDDYYGLMGSRGSLDEVVTSLRTGDYSSPKAVYEINVSDDYYSYTMETEDAEFKNLSSDLKDYVNRRAKQQFAITLNSRYAGMAAVAANGVFQGTSTFYCDALQKDTMYLYVFENGYPIIVTFTKGKDATASAIGNFWFTDSIRDGDATLICDILKQSYFIGDVTVKEVQYSGKK